MAAKVTYPGRLIAVDGSRGKDTTRAANDIVDALKRLGVECAISRWDASGLFGELAAGARGGAPVSMRTLSLVYAADLAFRIRWEIRPVLEAGGVVIAAPYVETAVAVGAVCGMGDGWVRDLLTFAPAPELSGRAEERKINRAWKPRADRGYAEFCAMMLAASDPKRMTTGTRRRVMTLLDQARGRKIFNLSAKGITALAKAATGSRRGASRRSASRPRNARS